MTRLLYIAQLIKPNHIPQPDANPQTLGDVLGLTFEIIGALAILMLAISAFRLVISSGEPQKVAEIRKQIAYILIGLVVALSAAAIITFIVDKVGG